MKGTKKTIIGLAVLLAIALGGVIYTHSWANYHTRFRSLTQGGHHAPPLVDTHALVMAQQLAPLAATSMEKEYAQQVLRLGDHSVDMAFAAALEDAAENPAPLTPETRKLTGRIKSLEAQVAADQDRVTQLTQQLAKARATEKDKIQQDLDLTSAQLSLDQNDLDDAHEDLIRAGGDKHASIQKLLDQHDASDIHEAADKTIIVTQNPSVLVERTQSKSVIAQVNAWLSLNSKQKQLDQARQEALVRSDGLAAVHQTLEKRLAEEKAQKKIIHKRQPASSAGLSPAPSSGAGSQTSAAPAAPPSTIDVLKHLSVDQKDLSQYDKRIEDEQQLAAAYADWITLVTARKQAFLHGLLNSAFWILLIALCVFITNEWMQRFFAKLAIDRRQLHTMRALMMFTIQALGVVLILLVIFGVPNNFATLAALAGAGLTVALKDFIVGFFGWFVLMGKDGIRPGDWVEINGVGGEVISVGLLHTVLLETGNWADAGHPTGRKVTFVNSFAIEGHYFNFSTSGQWLWDEIQVSVPERADPYSVAESIKKAAADMTAANAHLAEQEWERVTPEYAKRSFSATPSMSVRPTGSGFSVSIRYLTRANERFEVRTKLYRAVVEILRGKDIPEDAAMPADGPLQAESSK